MPPFEKGGHILNSFGNKGLYCQALSGNEYTTARDTGSRGGDQDGWLFLSPCSVRFFFPTFIEKQNKIKQKKSRVLRDEYFPSLLIEKKTIRAFLPTFRAEKEICGLFGTDFFFKVTRIYFFITYIKNMIKNGIPM